METVPQKVLRHIREKDFSVDTLKRGLSVLKDVFEARDITRAQLILASTEEDCGGQEGLHVYHYQLVVPEKHLTKASRTELGRIGVDIVSFPHDSHVECVTRETSGMSSDDFLVPTHVMNENQGFVCFRGPTSDDNTYPNNGYYDHTLGYKCDFRDTNPSGQRRGAIHFDNMRRKNLVNDEIKWQIVRGGFQDCRQLIGTAFYLTNADDVGLKEARIFSDKTKSRVSYLIQYIDPTGARSTAYAHFDGLVTRTIVNNTIKEFMNQRGGVEYIAVELELNGSGAVIKSDARDLIPIRIGAFYNDWDEVRFVVKRNSSQVV